MIKKFQLADVAHVKPVQQPKPQKKRKKPVRVGSLSPQEKNAIRYILAERLKVHKEFAVPRGMAIFMDARTLYTWFANERGREFPGYTAQVLAAVLRDANETYSPVLRVGHGKYAVNEEVFQMFRARGVA